MPQSIEGGVVIINTLSTKNNGDYPLVMAESVEMKNGKNVEDEINEITENISGIINDTDINQSSTWSSENIVSRICPPFEVSGNIVTCQPIEGINLNIISDSIDTSTIFISGKNLFSGIKSTTGSNTYFAQYNSDVWLKPDTTYTLSFNIRSAKEPFAVSVGVGDVDIPYRTDISRTDGINNGSFKTTFKTPSAMTYHLMSFRAPRYTETQSGISGELSEIQLEYANDASEYEAYKGESIEYSGENISIPALSGINTIFADLGDVTVSGYSDPNAIINALSERITALETATTSLIINELDYN